MHKYSSVALLKCSEAHARKEEQSTGRLTPLCWRLSQLAETSAAGSLLSVFQIIGLWPADIF